MHKALILVGHPLNNSFSAALAERYAQSLRLAGIEVRILHLAELDFPLSLPSRRPQDAAMPADVARFWDDLLWADHFALVHPLWWGGMPAKLKALFDITLQSGKAYRYEGKNPLPLGLLKGRTARLIVSSDTPGWFMALAYGNAHFRQVKNQVLKFIGFDRVSVTHCAVLRGSSAEQRTAMLDRLERDAGRDLRRRVKPPGVSRGDLVPQ